MLLSLPPEAIVGILVALVVGITFHEFSHAAVADSLGDHRPRALGRVSLNPARHIDPFGALFFVLAGFGWGRPVPVNIGALRGGANGMAMVAAAGPIANVVVALVFAVVSRALGLAGIDLPVASGIIWWVVLFNFVLAVFNLLPIPPLDGYNVLLAFLPPRHAWTLQRYGQYGMLVLLGLVFLSYVRSPINPLGWIFGLAYTATGLVLG
jgi:Zn-dependent protease